MADSTDHPPDEPPTDGSTGSARSQDSNSASRALNFTEQVPAPQHPLGNDGDNLTPASEATRLDFERLLGDKATHPELMRQAEKYSHRIADSTGAVSAINARNKNERPVDELDIPPEENT